MPTEVYLVKVGMNMTEGVVEEWYIPDGGTVTEGELLYRLETEKVNLDVDAEATGTIRHLVEEGVTMNPGDIVGYIYGADEVIPDSLPGGATGATGQSPVEESRPPTLTEVADRQPLDGHLKASPLARRLAQERNIDLTTLQGSGPGGRIVESDILTAPAATVEDPASAQHATASGGTPTSSPIARKLARELGLDLSLISGTGPGGRITKEDVERAAAAPPSATGPAAGPAAAPATTVGGEDQVERLKGMRRTIAKRMHDSLQQTAQLTMDMDVCMDDAIKLRTQLVTEWEDRGIRPGYTDLVIRAAAKALVKHPAMNSQLTEDALVLRGEINVGMAVALDEGLIVPVVRHADQLSLEQIAGESARLAAAARDSSLTPDDLQDGTFTVTALGMFGVDSFTPIVNQPQAGILGVNRIRDDVRWEAGTPLRTQVMRLSLTWDHRVLDGAPAAQFLAEVRDLLEAPYRLLV